MIISLKTNPKVKAFVQRFFPGYRKHSVSLNKTAGVSMSSYWDGGSRDEWHKICTLAGSHSRVAAWGGNYDRSQDGPTKGETGNGVIFVENGTFLGKPSTMAIYVSPEDSNNLFGEIVS